MIRKANPEDAGKINEILYQVQEIHAAGRPDIFRAGNKKYTDEQLAELILNDQYRIFVYEEDGEILGYTICIIQETQETFQLYYRKTLYIDDLCIEAAARGKGAGKALYEHVLEEARKLNCNSVTLNVWALNEPATAFYEKLGLKPLKTTMEQIL